jgi:ABC-type lipoprotein export system ATPase subunit
MTALNWCAVFEPARSLDKLLLTVKALRPESFDECLRLVNLALGHRRKRITGFNDAGRLEVEGESENGMTYRHPVEQLSSGERQMLLLTAYAVALLRPGGVFIVDEPDLHVGVAMVTQLMETLETVVRGRNGQLIVASNEQQVWDWFGRKAERIQLDAWRKGVVGAAP